MNYKLSNMIIIKEETKPGTTEKQIQVTIDNGDLQLIDSLVEAYNLKDRESFLKFAVAALVQGNNAEGLHTIRTHTDSEGVVRRVLQTIAPSGDMLKPKA